MPRYFFNVDDGNWTLDEAGTELPDLAAARHHALRLTGALLADRSAWLKRGSELMVEVTDSMGMLLIRLDLNLVEYPAEGSD